MSTVQNKNSRVSPPDSQTSTNAQEREGGFSSTVAGSIKSMIEKIGIEEVYGSPISHGETTVVPVATLRTGFGFGSGHDDQSDAGGGEGGGAGLRLAPRGYIEITSEGARYRPIYNVNTLVVGGAFVGWLLYRLLSRR